MYRNWIKLCRLGEEGNILIRLFDYLINLIILALCVSWGPSLQK